MENLDAGLIQQRTLEEARKYVCNSGQFRTAEDLAELLKVDLDGLRTRLEAWKNRGEIFSIRNENSVELFPVFAFDRSREIRLVDAIAKVLFIFGHRLSEWAIASWFIGLNSYLDDHCPKDLLEEFPEWVFEAAHDAIDEGNRGR